MGRKSRSKWEKHQVHILLQRRPPHCSACHKTFDSSMDYDVQPEGVCWRCPCGEVTVGRALLLRGEEGLFISLPLSAFNDEPDLDEIAVQGGNMPRNLGSLTGF